jgi:hypothetical protein
MDQQTQDRIVFATVTESEFVAIEWNRDSLERMCNNLHENFDSAKISDLSQEVSRWMDQAPQYPMSGGFAHRIFHGHSLSDIASVYHEHGFQGVLAWSEHAGADFCSPDGLPLPFAKEVMDRFGLNTHEAINLLTFNSTDLLACSVGIPGIALIPDPTVKAAASMAKLYAGIAHSDPSLIITAAVGCILSVSYVLSELSNRTTLSLIYTNFREFSHNTGKKADESLIFSNFKQVHR